MPIDLTIVGGLVAGIVLNFVNYYILKLTIVRGTESSTKGRSRAWAYLSFFVRFTTIGLIMYYSLINLGVKFLLALVAGITLLKIIYFLLHIKSLTDKKV